MSALIIAACLTALVWYTGRAAGLAPVAPGLGPRLCDRARRLTARLLPTAARAALAQHAPGETARGPIGASPLAVPTPRRDASGELEKRLADIEDHLSALRHVADTRAREVERYREGHDFVVLRSFARGVVRALDHVRDYREQLAGADGPPQALERLDAIADQLLLVLEAHQIEAFWAEPGVALGEQPRRLVPVARVPAASPDQIGRVCAVRYPGYAVALGDGREAIVREAQVSVFCDARPESEDP